MKGNLYTFNNRHGFAIGEDNKKYFVHQDEIITENKTIGCVIKVMKTATPSAPISITFTPEKMPASAVWEANARNVRIQCLTKK